MRAKSDVFHLAIPVDDLDEAQHFYVTQLGCKLARRYEDRITLDFFGDQVVCHLDRRRSNRATPPARLYPRHFGVTFRRSEEFDALYDLALLRKIPFFSDLSTRFDGRGRGAPDLRAGGPVPEPRRVQALPRPKDDVLTVWSGLDAADRGGGSRPRPASATGWPTWCGSAPSPAGTAPTSSTPVRARARSRSPRCSGPSSGGRRSCPTSAWSVGGTVGVAPRDPSTSPSSSSRPWPRGGWSAPLDAGAPDPELRRRLPAGPPRWWSWPTDRRPAGAGCEWLELPAGSFQLLAADVGPARSAAGRGGRPADRPPAAGPDRRTPSAAAPAPGGLVLSTSGTTGTPKVISLDEGRLLHAAGRIAGHHRLSVIDRGFNPLPALPHQRRGGRPPGHPWWPGPRCVLDDRFHRRGLLELVTERRVTWINAVPAIISRLAPLAADEPVPATLRFVRSASAPLPPAVAGAFRGGRSGCPWSRPTA